MALLSFTGSPHGGALKLLPEWNTQPKIRPILIIDHSIVGGALGAYYYFRDVTGLESHFIIRLDGMIWQLMDTDRQADANLDANRFPNGDGAISIETEDNGDPNNFPWSVPELNSLKWLHHKLRVVHPTISRLEVDSCHGSGLGYHSKMGAPSCWTPVPGKTCPGDPIRIGQWKTILLPDFLSTEDGMAADPEVLAALDAIRKEINALYRNGFSAQDATGALDPTHEGVAVRGVNNELNKQTALLTEIKTLLASVPKP